MYAGQVIKERLDLKEVMQFYGVKFNRNNFANCPFHGEKTGSMSIKNQRYKCFGCGAGGDVFDFIQQQFNLTFWKAVKKLDYDFNLNVLKETKNVSQEKRKQLKKQWAENNLLNERKKRFNQSLEAERDKLAKAYRVLFKYYLHVKDKQFKSDIGNYLEEIEKILNDETEWGIRAWKN